MKEYKVIVKEVFKFRDGTGDERTVLEMSTSELETKWREQLGAEPVTLDDLLDEIKEYANAVEA